MPWAIPKPANDNPGIRIVHRGRMLPKDATIKANEDATFLANLARASEDDTQPQRGGHDSNQTDAFARKKVLELENRCKSLTKALQDSKLMGERMATQIQQHEAQRAALEASKKEAEENEGKAQRRLEREQKRISKVEQDHGLQLQELRVEKERFRKPLLDAIAEKAKLSQLVATLQQEVAEKSSLITGMQAERNALECTRKSLVTQVLQLEQKLAKATSGACSCVWP